MFKAQKLSVLIDENNEPQLLHTENWDDNKNVIHYMLSTFWPIAISRWDPCCVIFIPYFIILFTVVYIVNMIPLYLGLHVSWVLKFVLYPMLDTNSDLPHDIA